MKTRIVLALALLAAVPLSALATATLIDENFESGLGTWQTPFANAVPGPAPDPAVCAPVITTLAGLNGPNNLLSGAAPAGNVLGFTWPSWPDSNSNAVSWVWARKQFHVTPGTYTTTLDVDRYVFKQNETGSYQIANEVFLLTDNLFDNAGFDPGGTDPNSLPGQPGWRTSRWNYGDGGPWSATAGGYWEHKTMTKTWTTTTGNVEVRLLIYEKNTKKLAPESVAWDNLKITGVSGQEIPEPAGLLLLALGLPLLLRKRA